MNVPAKSVTNHPTIIVFGVSAIGKPRAGTFKGSDVSAARKAAAKLGLSVARPHRRGWLSSCRKGTSRPDWRRWRQYHPVHQQGPARPNQGLRDQRAKERPGANDGELPTSPEATPRLPRSWDDIKVGDRVLAQETDPLDGWWHVSVTEVNGDLFKLRWPSSGRGRPFQKHRTMLGLICPPESKTDGKDDAKPDPKQSASKSIYPANWSTLTVDQTVLAKEDGPMEQWWEAKIVKIDKDHFTLQWRDYPKLPQIVRSRSSLGLMHPAPKVA